MSEYSKDHRTNRSDLQQKGSLVRFKNTKIHLAEGPYEDQVVWDVRPTGAIGFFLGYISWTSDTTVLCSIYVPRLKRADMFWRDEFDLVKHK